MSLYRPAITVLGAIQYEQQTPAYLSVTPTENSWYTILDTTGNVLLEWIRVMQTNSASSAKSLRMRVTIDGQETMSSFTSCAHATVYYCYMIAWGPPHLTTDERNAGRCIPWPAKSVKVEVQFGDTPGANQSLEAYVIYAKLKATTL